MKKIIIFIVFVSVVNIINAQIKVLNTGQVGFGTTFPKAEFQIGDKWTFSNGGTKVIGYNSYYDGVDKRIATDYSTCIRMDSYGIKFGIAPSGNVNTAIPWQFPLYLLNNNSIQINGNTSIVGNTNISGLAYCTLGYWSSSDEKVKENIRPITNAIDLILKLKGKKYNFKTNKLYNPNNFKTDSYGFIAQELKSVIPDLVGETDDSLKTMVINYDGLIPILIEAVKEQQVSIDSLKQIINNNSLKNGTIQSTNLSSQSYEARLFQNSPNPFSQSTKIDFYLSEIIQNAKINIYDLNGLQIKSITIVARGNGTVSINGYEMQPGMYLYTLIADGKEIETKRMILMQ